MHSDAVMLPSIFYQQVLNQLKGSDRLSELLALLRVCQRMLVGAHRATNCLPGYKRPGHAQNSGSVAKRLIEL
jgi:hypothetical protein